MTVETPQPQPGDTVMIHVKGVVTHLDDHDRVVMAKLGDEKGDGTYIPEHATVEVLERAGDPAVGEIRREDHDGGHSIWQVEEHEDGERYWRCTYSTAKGNRGVTFELGQMLDLPVIGAVPGTPAAEAQQQIADALPDWERELIEKESAARPWVRVPNEPHGLPYDMQQRIGELLARGDVDGAGAIAGRYMDWGEVDGYLRDRPEFQTGINHNGGKRETCTRDDCPGGTRCSSGATVLHDKTPECEEGTEVGEVEADRMRAMGFDKQPEFELSSEDRALIHSVLDERGNEYVYGQDDGSWKLDGTALTGVVADIVYAAIVQDRKRGDR